MVETSSSNTPLSGATRLHQKDDSIWDKLSSHIRQTGSTFTEAVPRHIRAFSTTKEDFKNPMHPDSSDDDDEVDPSVIMALSSDDDLSFGDPAPAVWLGNNLSEENPQAPDAVDEIHCDSALLEGRSSSELPPIRMQSIPSSMKTQSHKEQDALGDLDGEATYLTHSVDNSFNSETSYLSDILKQDVQSSGNEREKQKPGSKKTAHVSDAPNLEHSPQDAAETWCKVGAIRRAHAEGRDGNGGNDAF
jgi:hypothetical protein